MRRKIPHAKLLVASVTAIAIAAGTYAFTATNVVPTSTAGAGSAGVSGYTVGSLHFALDAAAPQLVDSATFTISPPIPSASTGKVIVSVTQSGAAVAYACTTNATGGNVTCPTGAPVVYAADITGFTVVAAQ
jgi:hypothetical protein